jgi:hypothetical protein
MADLISQAGIFCMVSCEIQFKGLQNRKLGSKLNYRDNFCAGDTKKLNAIIQSGCVLVLVNRGCWILKEVA